MPRLRAWGPCGGVVVEVGSAVSLVPRGECCDAPAALLGMRATVA